MKILFYEMRKSWFKVVVLVVLIVTTFLDFLRIYPKSEYLINNRAAYHEVFEDYGGVPQDDKLQELAKKADAVDGAMLAGMRDVTSDEYYTGNAAWEDSLLNSGVKPQIEYVITYPNVSAKTSLKAYENYELYKELGRSYDAAENALIYNVYSGRSVSELRGNKWAERFLAHDFSSLACLVLLVLGLSGMFSTERESGMNALIGAYGKTRKTIAAKALSAAIFCAILTVWFTAFDLVMFNTFDNFSGIDLPLYSLSKYQYTPLNFSILQTVFFWCAQRFLALFTVSMALCLISEIAPNTVTATVGGFALCMVLVVIGGVQKNILNPISALTPENYITDFKAYNFFGKPLLQPYAALIVLACESALICGIILICRKVRRRS